MDKSGKTHRNITKLFPLNPNVVELRSTLASFFFLTTFTPSPEASVRRGIIVPSPLVEGQGEGEK